MAKLVIPPTQVHQNTYYAHWKELQSLEVIVFTAQKTACEHFPPQVLEFIFLKSQLTVLMI